MHDGKIQNSDSTDTKNLAFGVLSPLGECLLTWTENCMMLLDVESDEIIASYDLFKVNNIVVWKEKTIYILHDVDEIKITKITFEESALLELMRVKKNWAGCLGLVSKYNIRDIPLLEKLLEDMKNAETADNQVSRLVVELENFIITEKQNRDNPDNSIITRSTDDVENSSESETHIPSSNPMAIVPPSGSHRAHLYPNDSLISIPEYADLIPQLDQYKEQQQSSPPEFEPPISSGIHEEIVSSLNTSHEDLSNTPEKAISRPKRNKKRTDRKKREATIEPPTKLTSSIPTTSIVFSEVMDKPQQRTVINSSDHQETGLQKLAHLLLDKTPTLPPLDKITPKIQQIASTFNTNFPSLKDEPLFDNTTTQPPKEEQPPPHSKPDPSPSVNSIPVDIYSADTSDFNSILEGAPAPPRYYLLGMIGVLRNHQNLIRMLKLW